MYILISAGIVNGTKLGKIFINTIMKDYIDIPDIDDMNLDKPVTSGMKFLKNVIDLETRTYGNVIVRSVTESYWGKVIEACETFRVCALGTPGIGKSTSTCILLRLLLKQSKTVAYLIRKKNLKGLVYLFTTQGTGTELKVDVTVIPEKTFLDDDQHFNNMNLYYVVNPGETKDSCSPGTDFLGKLIIVTSPYEGHWGMSEFTKGRGFDSPNDESNFVLENELKTQKTKGIFLFFPVWTLPELLASLPYISKNYQLNASTVKDRFFKFGGVPRYIFTSAVEGYEKEQNRALSNLNFETAMDFAKIDRNAIETLSEKSPRGILLSFILSENDEGSFENAHATLSSDLIYEKFTNRYMGMLWEQIVPNFGKFDPYLFAMYCAVMLCDRNEQKKLAFTTRKMTGQNRDSIELTRCSTREKVHNIIEAARLDEKILFLPISPTYEFIDFAYRDGNTYHCFQCTIGLKHTQNPKHIYQLLLNVYNNEEINLLASMTEEELPRVKLYYAVPAFRFDVFSSKHPNAMAEAKEYCIHKNENNSLFYYWDKLVSIDIMSIDRPNSKEPTKLVEEAKPQDLITSTLSMHQIYGCLDTMPGLYGQLLSFKKDEQIDGLIKSFKIDKLKVCLRCLSLKPKGNKNDLISQLQNAKQHFIELIEQLQNAPIIIL